MIHYLCPDVEVRSGGVRVLYQHVDLLTRHGFPATIVHQKASFRAPDMPDVPVTGFDSLRSLGAEDFVVIPEGMAGHMAQLKRSSARRVAIALNWKFVYTALPSFVDWRAFGIERVLCQSPFIGDFLEWSMKLPVHCFGWGLNDDLFYFDPEQKQACVVYIERKAADIDELKRALYARDARFVRDIGWVGLGGLSFADYAREVRRAGIFLNLSPAEGFPVPEIEAMAAGTLLVGYNGVGGQRELIGHGEKQNCILAENLDYVTLAWRLEPVLKDVLAGDLTPWAPIIENGLKTAATYSRDAEESAIIAMWREILDTAPPVAPANGAVGRGSEAPASDSQSSRPGSNGSNCHLVFDEHKVDLAERQLPKPYGTLCSVDQDHLQRYALARAYCRGKTVLDGAMGCGYGSLLIDGAEYIGIDPDENLVAFARQYYAPLAPKARYEQGDVTALSLRDESVDAYVSFETIECLPPDDVPRFFAEAKRVLRPGGRFICSSPIFRGPRFGLTSPHHAFEYGYGQLQRAIAQGGFTVERVFYQSPFLYIPRPEPPPIDWTQGIDPHVTICVAVKP